MSASTFTDSLLVVVWVSGAARSPSVLPGEESGLVAGDSPGASARSSESLSTPTLRSSLHVAMICRGFKLGERATSKTNLIFDTPGAGSLVIETR